MRFYKFPKWLKRFYPNAIWDFYFCDSSKNIYLTFDDGPTPEITEWVLNQLDKFHAKATFFCIGKNVVNHPQIYNQILGRGHSVGNHTMNHINGSKVNSKKYIEDVLAAEKYINSKWYRPPYGKCTPKQYKKLQKLGFKTVFWTHISYDFDPKLSTDTRVNKIIENIKPGAVIVFHDSVKAFPQLKNELPIILNYLKNQNYNILKLPTNNKLMH
jgi:peptidoglycan/xylan/chitin deacetylase (PgdA/CDA1 family)